MLRLVTIVVLALTTLCSSLQAQAIHPALTSAQLTAIDQFVTKEMERLRRINTMTSSMRENPRFFTTQYPSS